MALFQILLKTLKKFVAAMYKKCRDVKDGKSKKELMMVKILMLLLIACVSLNAQVAAAQDDKVIAQSLYREGLEYFEQKEYDKAAICFKKANDIKFHWKVLYNIAQCEAAAKRHGAALQFFEQYLARGGDEILTQRKDMVLDEIVRLRIITGYVNVKAPPGATILVDGYVRGIAPLSTPLTIAASIEHRFVVVADGEEIHRQNVTVLGGQFTHVNVDNAALEGPRHATIDDVVPSSVADRPTNVAIIPMESPLTNAAEPDPDANIVVLKQDKSAKERPLKLAGIVTLSVGVGALIGGIIVGAKALSEKSKLLDSCEGRECEPDYHDDVDSLSNKVIVTNVLMGAGIAMASSGLIMIVVDKLKSSRESNVGVGMHVSSQFSAVSFQRSF